MRFGGSKTLTGRDPGSWPVFLLLLVVVLVPTLGVLWFMSQAMLNEQLAVRQRLSDVYRDQLLALRDALENSWRERSEGLEIRDTGLTAGRLFADRVRGGAADAVVIYTPDDQPAYPAPILTGQAEPPPGDRSWRRAERLEHGGQSEAAATRYGAIAEAAREPHRVARALQAQARCLARAGRVEEALEILVEDLDRPELATATDPQGRMIALDTQLRALQLLGDGTHPSYRPVAMALARRLNSYHGPELPAAQRRFLVRSLEEELERVAYPLAERPTFDTRAAEELAQRYLDAKINEPSSPAPSAKALRPTSLPGTWHLATADARVVALYEEESLRRDFEVLLEDESGGESVVIELLAPGVEPEGELVVSLAAGALLPEWRLALSPADQGLFATAAEQRINAYRLTGFLVVLAIFGVSILGLRAMRRQLRLTRLKNDLLSTVSHELKTPLASMRLLVDTLLDNGVEDSRRVEDYLRLIAQENTRLSRLVDNFLTFSRLEQGRERLARTPIAPTVIVEAAVASVEDRFRTAGCRFEVETETGLADVLADHDALVTVLLNLLDNAYKYSRDSETGRHIVLRTFGEGRQICFAVVDHGIGLSPRAVSKIFDRFYQVDQELTRSQGGCGLGLSIVERIVAAHGGKVEVESRPGEGSTFTVRLPASDDHEPLEGEGS